MNPNFRLGDLLVRPRASTIERDGEERRVDRKAMAVLVLLAERSGEELSKREILDAVWGRGSYVTHRTIDTHVLHVRQKLEADFKAPRFLLTVHGVGYRLILDGPPTSTESPSSPFLRRIVPANGVGISTVVLAVSTSTTTWSTATVSPTATCQATISASVNPSPMSGSRNSSAMRAIYRPPPEPRAGTDTGRNWEPRVASYPQRKWQPTVQRPGR